MNNNTVDPTYFETITQYDQKFDDLWIANPTVKKGLACPYFSLFTAEMFMSGSNIDKFTHEIIIESAINANILVGSNDEMDFKQFVGYTDLHEKDIGCTLAELIQVGEFKLDELFTSDSEKYCVIFLKNAKFFVVLCDKNGYHLRDAHESVQYTFFDKTQLIDKLNSTYQFNCVVDVGGVMYGDYSSIEFIKVEHKFNNILNNLLETAADNYDFSGDDDMVKAIAESLDHKELSENFDSDHSCSGDDITDISDTE
jgi:hypothetical protein